MTAAPTLTFARFVARYHDRIEVLITVLAAVTGFASELMPVASAVVMPILALALLAVFIITDRERARRIDWSAYCDNDSRLTDVAHQDDEVRA